MPAIRSEIEEAAAEGVEIEPWCAPAEIGPAADGGLRVEVQRMQAGPVDESGRARPEPVDGAIETRTYDAVVVAVAQEPDWAGLEAIRPDGSWAGPDEHGRLGDDVWTGGDVVGPGTVAAAIGWGRRAAESMHARIRGMPDPALATYDPIEVGDVKPDLYPGRPRTRPRAVAADDAVQRRDLEVHLGITAREFDYELSRCLSCGRCFGCEHCFTYCVHGCFDRLEEAGPGAYFVAALDACRGCGKCLDVCPSGYLRLDEPIS
jgi:Pyruvate/2-oxoacid:ferredoxin oxidoreductase delta subunit